MIAFGLLVFTLFLLKAMYQLRFAATRDQRLESAGAAVPGVGGLCLAGIAYSTSLALSIGLAVVGLATLVVGRAVYELIVFQPRSPR